MDDLISRSKLLKEIETWGGCVEALHEYISNMPTAYDVDAVIAGLKKESYQEWCDSPKIVELNDAIEIVKDLAEEHNNGWISVEDALPEEAFGCLVTIMDCNPMTLTDFETVLPYHVGYDGETWNDIEGNVIPFEVIAWRPLPAPYKKGE